MTFALITGAAKRIGMSISIYLASKGYNIILHYNSSKNEAYDTAEKIRSIGRDVHLCHADLSTENGMEYLKSFCDKFEISLLVNNASVFKNDSLLSDDIAESLNEHLQVNLISKVAIIQRVSKSVLLHQMRKLDIINLLDYGIFKTPNNFFSYHLTNRILYSFTQLAARQLAPNAVVNSIALGQTIKNDMQSQKNFDSAITSTPLMCSSTIEEIYKAIDFIIGVKSMTGQVICLDGGMHLSDNQYK